MYKLNCNCGKSLKVDDRHLGKRVKCPACETVLRVPEHMAGAAAPARTATRPAPIHADPFSDPASQDFDLFSSDPYADPLGQPAGFASPPAAPGNMFAPPKSAAKPKRIVKRVKAKRESTTEWGRSVLGC